MAKDLHERVRESGEEVAYQEWDSGGPGAGAGRNSVYRYRGRYYAAHDAGLDGPFTSLQRALERASIEQVTDATVEIWRADQGVTYRRS